MKPSTIAALVTLKDWLVDFPMSPWRDEGKKKYISKKVPNTQKETTSEQVNEVIIIK